MANCPDKWEVNGIIRILEAAANYKVKIHIPNISSASSYIKLRQAKDLNLPITCETSANYLFFTDDMITQG